MSDSDRQLLARIGSDPNRLAGKPVIKGTRLSVDHILNLLAHGSSEADIIGECEGLGSEDIRACLLFAAESISSRLPRDRA